MNTMLNTALVAFSVVGSCVVFGELVTESNGTAMENLNGKSMFNIGRNLKNPLLMLLGRTLGNIQEEIQGQICDLHPCEEWTVWSSCEAKWSVFGTQFRSRKCGLNRATCKMESESRLETESKLCVHFCPKDYNETKHGFCIKLYTDKKKNQNDAESLCQKDGGHLINIDSEQKYNDVNEMLGTFGYGIWVDGRRNDNHSPWEYKYGANHTISKWYSGYPNNASDHLCLVIAKYSGSVFWHDQPCSTKYYTMCELSRI